MRGKVIVAALGLTAVVAVGVVAFGPWADPCMNGGGGASCPALADVNGVRYTVSGGEVLESINRALLPYGTMSKTNTPSSFAGSGVMQVAGIDPRALLVAVGAPSGEPNHGYVLLFGPDEGAYPAVCEYFPSALRAVTSQC